MRLCPDSRGRSNRIAAPTASTEAPGKPPAPEMLPGPRLPPPIPASHQRYFTHLTVEHCAAEPCTALQLLGHQKGTGSSKMLLWHQRRCVRRTTCKDNTEQRARRDMHRQSEPRAGNHQRHTRTRNASLPTQANHTVRGARKEPPNWALHMQLAKIPHTQQTTPPATLSLIHI